MRYRRLDEALDYAFGHGAADYLSDSPECVAQAVGTRLRLLAGEWFLDLQEGIPYAPAVLGRHTKESYDPVIRARILETDGVTGITEYESEYDGETRRLVVSVTIDTVYGTATVQEVM